MKNWVRKTPIVDWTLWIWASILTIWVGECSSEGVRAQYWCYYILGIGQFSIISVESKIWPYSSFFLSCWSMDGKVIWIKLCQYLSRALLIKRVLIILHYIKDYKVSEKDSILVRTEFIGTLTKIEVMKNEH